MTFCQDMWHSYKLNVKHIIYKIVTQFDKKCHICTQLYIQKTLNIGYSKTTSLRFKSKVI